MSIHDIQKMNARQVETLQRKNTREMTRIEQGHDELKSEMSLFSSPLSLIARRGYKVGKESRLKFASKSKVSIKWIISMY